MSKINLYRIIADHFQTFGHHGSRDGYFGDVLVFILLPVVVASIGYWKGVNLRSEAVSILVTAFSVFAGLLLNLLMLIYGLIQKAPNNEGRRLKSRFLKEIYSNISFTVFLSLLIIVIAAVAMSFAASDGADKGTGPMIGPLYSVVLVFLAAHFVMTFLMVLKRVHILLANEFD